jgi:hypothetical protein
MPLGLNHWTRGNSISLHHSIHCGVASHEPFKLIHVVGVGVGIGVGVVAIGIPTAERSDQTKGSRIEGSQRRSCRYLPHPYREVTLWLF